jgi:exodeoxyribonuclease VII large subunit
VRPNPFELLGSPLARSAPGVTREKPISVSDLATETRVLVESALQPVWVRGEICDFKRYRSGHWYFSLRDNSAQIRCVVWASDQRGIPASPDDGMQVIVFGQMTVYPARAELQLRIRRIEAVGDGLWRKAMEQTLAKLRSEGLLEEGRKRPIPQFPKRVAIVTSADGAAIRDIVAVMRNRNAGIQLVLCQARVQGDGAALEIAAALRRVAKWALADVVIVGRGGGSKEDLWAFNDERVARAVVECPVPVISAVGHEVDITVCDAVADLRASTPSAAAAAACSARVEIEKAFALARHHLSDAITSRVQGGRNELERLNRCIA